MDIPVRIKKIKSCEAKNYSLNLDQLPFSSYLVSTKDYNEGFKVKITEVVEEDIQLKAESSWQSEGFALSK